MKNDIAILEKEPQTLPAISPELYLTPSSDIEHYIAKVRQIPILSAEEEHQLALEMHEHHSIEAAQRLIIHHLKFVVHIARGFNGYGLPLGDLIQEGNIGLMKAVKRFEPKRGVRLISFAVHWIKSEIHEYVIKNWRIVKVATTKAQRKLFFKLRSLKKSTQWLNQQEAQDIADTLNVSVQDVYEMENRLQGQDIAFDPLDNDEDDYTPSSWLVSESDDPALSAEKNEQEARLKEQLHAGLEKLDPRSREIIESRFLNEEGKATLQTLAQKYQVSAERIRQIEQQALLDLRNGIHL